MVCSLFVPDVEPDDQGRAKSPDLYCYEVMPDRLDLEVRRSSPMRGTQDTEEQGARLVFTEGSVVCESVAGEKLHQERQARQRAFQEVFFSIEQTCCNQEPGCLELLPLEVC